MASTKEQVLSFLQKCDELRSCKFIMATTKIKDLLKCIVNCPELYRLFETVTKDFDYPSQKAVCLVTKDDGILARSYVSLPGTLSDRLAFIFCLLVEIDKEVINFNDFLRLYFSEDGSYFACYKAFGNKIIKSLQDAVIEVFDEEMLSLTSVNPNAEIAEIISTLEIALSQEMQFVEDSPIPADDKENGIKILSALLKAVKAGNEELIDCLLCGYNYFILHLGCVSDGITELIQLIEVYEKNL
ncbi:MAG: hypothetical protein K2K80_00920 [Clostridia bacterium]|nr:hypothetical protein [Clostridia bacterium]